MTEGGDVLHDRDDRRRRGLEAVAIVLLLLSAMLDPLLTFGLAAAILSGVFVLSRLGQGGRASRR